MNGRHLTSEEMDVLLMDDAAREQMEHLQACDVCMEELESLQRTLAALRGAVVATAAQQRQMAVMPAAAGRTRFGIWSLVAATALLCAAGPMVLHSRPARGPVTAARPPQASVSQISDAQLMSDIEQDLSSSVPQAMLPLTAKSAGAGGADANSTTKENE